MTFATLAPFVLLALVAALWLSRPLWQRQTSSALRRNAANAQVFTSRLGELENEVQVGLLPVADHAELKAELNHRLVAEASAPEAASAISPRKPLLAAVLVLLLAGSAGLWYWQAGSWQLAQQIANAPSGASGVPASAEVAGMVQKLADRLAANPEDPAGWALLGRSQFVLERYAEAATAYGQANSRSQSSNAEWLTSEGESLALARDRDLLGKPAQLFSAALALDPSYSKALWYGGLAAKQGGDAKTAIARLTQLSTQASIPDEARAAVNAQLLALGAEPAAPTAANAVVAKAPAASTASAPLLSMQVHVDVAPQLRSKLPANAILFVFAKAAAGPPMPLAVQRLPGATLPITVTLDDSMAMTPALKLSQFDRYVITARLSTSGSVTPAPGDLQGSTPVERSALGQPVQVMIDQP